MLLKTLVVAILAYYVFRVAANLYRAIQGDGGARRMESPRRRRPPQERTPQERATRDYVEEDVEDATWVDLD